MLGIGGFDEVLTRSVVARFSCGEFRFLKLDALISAQAAAGRERDLITLRYLRAIQERIAPG